MPTPRQVRDQRRHLRSSLLYCQYSGDVTGELVYVNYGTVEDIRELHQMGVNLTGREQRRINPFLAVNTCHSLQRPGNIGSQIIKRFFLTSDWT
jgi:hypothetical protein